MAQRKELTTSGFLSKNDENKGRNLAFIIDSYLSKLQTLEEDKLAGLLPLIVFIEINHEKNLEDTHHTAWKYLTEALDYDRCEWPENVP